MELNCCLRAYSW